MSNKFISSIDIYLDVDTECFLRSLHVYRVRLTGFPLDPTSIGRPTRHSVPLSAALPTTQTVLFHSGEIRTTCEEILK